MRTDRIESIGGGGRGLSAIARGGRTYTRATTPTRSVRRPAKTPTVAKKRAEAAKQASERLATRNKTQLSRAMDRVKINPASLGSKVKSGNPAPNRGGGLRTTTGQGKKKTSRADVYEAVRSMSSRPGGSGHTTGTGAIRGTAPKPYVRVTTQSGRTKATVQKPLKKTNPSEKGSAITVRKTTPRKAADVREQAEKERRNRLRNALTPTQNPARPKIQPKRGVDRSSRNHNVEDENTTQGITIRGKFYADGNPGPIARGGTRQGTIESRLSNRAEKPTFGNTRRGELGKPDAEADKLANNSLRNIESPAAAARNNNVKPGQRTKVAKAIQSGNRADILRSIQNMRRVLKEREITVAGKKIKLTKEELAKIERKLNK